MANPTQPFPLFRLLAGSVCISFSPVFIKIAAVDPDLAGFYRMLFAGVGLSLITLLRRGKLRVEQRPLLFLIGCGIFLGLDFMCWHRSINLVGPGLSTLLGNFQVFFTALFSWLFLKERITPLFALAVAMAFCGLLLITGADLSSLTADVKLGIFLGLLTAVFYSLYIMFMKQAMSGSKMSGSTAVLIVTICSLLFLGFLGLAKGISFAVGDSRSLLALAAVGLISTALGWSMISTAIRVVPATVAGLVLLLQPTLAFFWDVLFFKRPTGIYEYLGLLLILSAIYLGTLRRVK